MVVGVSVEFLLDFAKKHKLLPGDSPYFFPGDHPNPPPWWQKAMEQSTDRRLPKSTGNVTNAHIVQETVVTQETYVDQDAVRSAVDSRGQPFVGKADYFVSHCWNRNFMNMVTMLESHSALVGSHPQSPYKKNGSNKPVYYWIDIFVKNQHAVQGDDTANELKNAVLATGKTIVICDGEWFSPECLERVWCLFEIMWSVRLKSQLIVLLPDEEVIRSLLTDGDEDEFAVRLHIKVSRYIANINVEEAKATVQTDKTKILKLVEDSIGIAQMNSTVAQAMTTELALSLFGLVKNKTGEQSIRLYSRSAMILRELELVDDASEMIDLAVKKFCVLDVVDDYEKSSNLDLQALDDLHEAANQYFFCHTDKWIRWKNVLSKRAQMSDALKSYIKTIQTMIRVRKLFFSECSYMTLRLLNTCFYCLMGLNMYEECEQTLNQVYKGHAQVRGPNCEDAVRAMHNFAFMHHEKGLYLYEQCCDIWDSDGQKGRLLLGDANGEFRKAADLSLAQLERCEKIFGKFHLNTLIALKGVALSLYEMVDENDVFFAQDESFQYFNEQYSRIKEHCGWHNIRTCTTGYHFASLLRKREKFDQAIAIWKEIDEGLTAVLKRQVATDDGFENFHITYTKVGAFQEWLDRTRAKLSEYGAEITTIDTTAKFGEWDLKAPQKSRVATA